MQNYTDIHPLALAFTIISGLLMLVLSRRAALVPLLFAVVFIPLQQRIVVFNLDFFILRILVLFGWIRVLLLSEYQDIQLNRVDKLMLLWAACGTIAFTLLWRTPGAFINRMGVSFDMIGVYFLTRFLVRDTEDIVWVIKTLAVVSIPIAAAMTFERSTGRNIFSIFGGVPEYTIIRDGKLRSQGAFEHSITAGSFSASLLPMFFAARNLRGNRLFLMFIGIVTATVITVCTSSSGPALSYLAALLGIYAWHFRAHMKKIRWCIVLGLIGLQIVMKAPVYALITRVKIFGASTAYHRFRLFDQFVHRFTEWLLLGVKSTGSWGWHLYDVTNYYVRIAVDGGLLTLILFISLLTACFSTVGAAVKSGTLQPGSEKVVWALGAALFVHVVSFFGVSYFDQIKVMLYLLFGMIGTVRSLTEKSAALRRAIAPEMVPGKATQ